MRIQPLGRHRYEAEAESDPDAGSSSGSDDDEDVSDGSESGSAASLSNDISDGPADDQEEDEDEHDVSDAEAEGKHIKPFRSGRSIGFKAWAQAQLSQTPASSVKPSPPPFAQGSPTEPNAATKSLKVALDVSKAAQSAFGPLGANLTVPISSLLDSSSDAPRSRPTVKRSAAMSGARMELPILAEEQAIVEAIRMNPVVMIAGETGSGKTTQVPQMLYEAGFGFKDSVDSGMIAITQPRRVAAVSLSARMREELCLPASSALVAHQIRYSSSTSPETSIKFMTDGVLLREMATDFLLSRYSVVIVDEAHERGVNTDVLIGLLSRVASLREKKWREGKDVREENARDPIRPLRIVIMSATLRISDFASNTTLFATQPPVVHIPARQHPVTTHFARKTVSDYLGEAYKKVCKIHARLPPGGVLVFLTGQGEIQGLCRKLEARYGKSSLSKGQRRRPETKNSAEHIAVESHKGLFRPLQVLHSCSFHQQV